MATKLKVGQIVTWLHIEYPTPGGYPVHEIRVGTLDENKGNYLHCTQIDGTPEYVQRSNIFHPNPASTAYLRALIEQIEFDQKVSQEQHTASRAIYDKYSSQRKARADALHRARASLIPEDR